MLVSLLFFLPHRMGANVIRGGALAPAWRENTLRSFQAAAASGATFVEFDVQVRTTRGDVQMHTTWVRVQPGLCCSLSTWSWWHLCASVQAGMAACSKHLIRVTAAALGCWLTPRSYMHMGRCVTGMRCHRPLSSRPLQQSQQTASYTSSCNHRHVLTCMLLPTHPFSHVGDR